ncbi:hypothetical protein BDW59DRAFT_155421 [Aspergillus cavernicola]|uniref:Epidermal growth factor receptor-like transmembrane-juxtamembrane segment domain-containing protein n=1 Tax=Aspergillus cavernicola TaxID=176166 RepID=A0ABR4H8Z7_9EURO
MASDCGGGSADCNFLCPSGGTWYVCETAPYFVGCCSSDPCQNSDPVCPDLYPASYNASAFDGTIYDQIRPNNCIGNSSSRWFTCNFTTPVFVGCCSSDPCGGAGCPNENVLPAAWSSSRDDQYELFLDESSEPAPESDSSSDLSGGAIAGIVVGAVAAVVIILAALFFLRRRKQQKKQPAPPEQQNMYTGEYGAYNNPSSPYQDSHMSSPPNPSAKYPSGSSAGFSLPSPPLSSLGNNSHRPISEIYTASSDDNLRPNHGLHISGAPQPIPELHSEDTPAKPEVHELDSMSR